MSETPDWYVGLLDGGCAICWHDERRGLLRKDDVRDLWVHPNCLDHLDVDSFDEFEREHIGTEGFVSPGVPDDLFEEFGDPKRGFDLDDESTDDEEEESD